MMGLITGTLISRVGGGYDVAVYTATDGLYLLASLLGLLFAFLFMLYTTRFQMWALSICTILMLAYLPFSLSVAAPVVAGCCIAVLLLARLLYFTTKVGV